MVLKTLALYNLHKHDEAHQVRSRRTTHHLCNTPPVADRCLGAAADRQPGAADPRQRVQDHGPHRCPCSLVRGCGQGTPPRRRARQRALHRARPVQKRVILLDNFTRSIVHSARDYVKQQAAARALFRLAGGSAAHADTPGSLYMGWVIASVALQARTALQGMPVVQRHGGSLLRMFRACCCRWTDRVAGTDPVVAV